jgi:hypothetical protein
MRIQAIAILVVVLASSSARAWEIDGHKAIADSAGGIVVNSEKNRYLEIKKFQDEIDFGVQDEDSGVKWENHYPVHLTCDV